MEIQAPPLPAQAARSRTLAILDWTGCLLGLLGAFALATHTDISRWGWLAFLAANFVMIEVARFVRTTFPDL